MRGWEPPDRDEHGDPIEDRQILSYRWHDVVYGVGAEPAIDIRVRFNPDRQDPEFVIYELTKAWLAICRSINGADLTTKGPTP